MDVNKFLKQVPTQAQSRSTFVLSASDAKLVDEFVKWLVDVDGKTKGSAASYRTYVSKPLALNIEWPEMTSSERSGARKFSEFISKVHPELLEDPEDPEFSEA